MEKFNWQSAAEYEDIKYEKFDGIAKITIKLHNIFVVLIINS